MKIIGKLYSGKPNVQFDEGELEIEPLATTPALYSTKRNKFDFRKIFYFLLHETNKSLSVTNIQYLNWS
jgi:hypothetical protein